ncbi:hypothetical protein TWF281_008857 [Arthrobotrys megalospora]
MKAVLALTASLSLASAALLPRQLDGLPACALNCALGSLSDTGCTNTADFGCICRATAFVAGLIPCVQRDCSASEIEATIQGATGLCLQAGVTLSIPPGVTETGAASSSAPASTSEAPSTETEASTTAPPAETTTAATTVAETTVASTEAPATTMPSNGTQTTGTRPPTPTGTEPGAASRNTVALGGLGAIVALVAAFL